MSLSSKIYTKDSETLEDILEGILQGISASGTLPPSLTLKVDTSSNHLHYAYYPGGAGINSVVMDCDLVGGTCKVVVTGDGTWYTSLTNSLDGVFGV